MQQEGTSNINQLVVGVVDGIMYIGFSCCKFPSSAPNTSTKHTTNRHRAPCFVGGVSPKLEDSWGTAPWARPYGDHTTRLCWDLHLSFVWMVGFDPSPLVCLMLQLGTPLVHPRRTAMKKISKDLPQRFNMTAVRFTSYWQIMADCGRSGMVVLGFTCFKHSGYMHILYGHSPTY